MRVWLITDGEPLPLPGRHPRLLRHGLLAAELARRGHTLTWWTSRFEHSAKQYFPGDTVQRLDDNRELRLLAGRPYHSNISWQRLVNHRQIAADFRRQSDALPLPDVVLCALPTIELALAAAEYGARRGVPVLIDVRDLWPDVLLGAVPGMLAPLGRLVLEPLYAEARRALRAATGLIGISDGYLDWALRLAGRARGPRDTVIPLGYPRLAVSPDQVEAAWQGLTAAGVRRDARLVLFLGSFGRSYDLAPAVAAARALSADPSLQFVLAGEGEGGAAWRAAAAGLPNVIFPGWIGAPGVAALLGGAWVGLAAYAADALQGLPNKIFEYLSAGLPVVSSLRGEAADLLAGRDCGLSYDVRSPGTLVAALQRLQNEPGLHARLGANARSTYDASYDSARVSDQLIACLEATALRQ